MIFGSQLRRQTLWNLGLMWIPDLIIAAVVSYYMDGGTLGFGIAVVALFVLCLVYWFLRSIVMWLAYLAFGKRTVQRQLYDYLVANKFPAPSEYESSAEEYFASVAQNGELDPGLRVKAALEVGTFAAYSGAFERQQLSKISLAAEAAIEEYRRHVTSDGA
jgi:hypothetical protein